MNPIKVLISTFSQTGTTMKVAGKISEGLMSSGMTVTFHSITNDPPPDIQQFDAIGIGCPVYVFRPPFPVLDYLKSMPDLKKKWFFTFVMYGTNPGAGGNIIRQHMKSKHAIDAGYLSTRGADYFIGYLRRGYLFSSGYPGDFELQTATEFGVKVAHRINNGHPAPEPYDPPTHFMYAIERASMNRMNARIYLSRSFRVGKECDGCGICIRKCPVHNLTEGKDKRPVWGNNCILCATCEYKCPQDAIRSPYDWAMNAPFLNYNVKKAMNDHTPFARVKFEKGRTILI